MPRLVARPRRDRGVPAEVRPTELPTVNMLVRLTPPALVPDQDGEPALEPAADPDAVDLASRVEDVRPATPGRPVQFLVAAPTYLGDLLDDPGDVPGPAGAEPVDGEVWVMSWVSDRARWELPVCRSSGEPGRGPRSWWLTPAGPVRRRQRRRFFRAPCGAAVELDQLSEPFRTLTGRTVDLSEGGVRCLLPLPDGDVAPGTRVLVRLSLAGVDGVLGAVVLRSRRPPRTSRVAGVHREVAIAFDDPERHGDAVRRIVVRSQLRSRRLAPPTSR